MCMYEYTFSLKYDKLLKLQRKKTKYSVEGGATDMSRVYRVHRKHIYKWFFNI